MIPAWSAPGNLLLHALLLLLLALGAAAAPALADDGFVGSERCAGCHQEAFEAWQGSHHDLAMQPVTATTVLGDFDDATFAYNGVETRFYRQDDAFMVRTDGPDGELRDYEVAYVFGVYPLQQYLLPLAGGRLQAFSIAWDTRPANEGGQRWYHLYPDDTVDHRDPLHWSGPYQNWNTRCAECHSTGVEKGYDAATHSFATRYEEIDVGCEGCHGPGRAHLDRAQAGTLADAPHGGFPASFAQRGSWTFPAGEPIARRGAPIAGNTQIDMCGRCHSRRGTLGAYHYGAELLDTHRLSLLQPPLYHADGQIRDEVYVYGSFVQSRMHRAGVVCSNCHEPHSNALRAPGNGVCAQCHRAETYDTPAHHRHAEGSGSQCVNCHMPARSYLGVDDRRDHSMRIPRPDLSLVLGTPDACTTCHGDRDAGWALAALRRWDMAPSGTAEHPARVLARLRQGDRRAAEGVRGQVGAATLAPIWRATALTTLGDAGDPELAATAAPLLTADDALLRLAAVRSLRALPLAQRYGLLQPLVADPVTAVRLEVAASLAGAPLAQLDKDDRAALKALFAEYLDIQGRHADMPSVQQQLGLFYAERGKRPAAEAAYRQALALNPQAVAAYLNLADLLRGSGREAEARTLLRKARTLVPDSGDLAHALGLLEIRLGNRDQALALLAEAAATEQQGTRHRYVHAIALHDLGDSEAALRALRALDRQAPGNPEVLLALANYHAELRRFDAALSHARRLLALEPSNSAWRRLVAALERQAGPGGPSQY